jgi:hypothetical protein
MRPTRRAVTVGHEAPSPGLASKVPNGSVPATFAWPSPACCPFRAYLVRLPVYAEPDQDVCGVDM